jgi:hypothetical protein
MLAWSDPVLTRGSFVMQLACPPSWSDAVSRKLTKGSDHERI